MDEKRLFLLDAYALIYRAYYALLRSPRVTSYGLNTSAIFGFCNTLDEVLRKEQPTHIAVCFDPAGGHTFRHELYADYKAGRDKQPEDITLAVPYIKEILGAYNIPVIEVEGYEADDVIGTLSRMAEREEFVTFMMTPDKDYGQLVTERVLMYRPSLRGEGFEIRGPKQVEEKYGIDSPHQVIDLLALEGDKSDNIPGCPGIGEKGAATLIREWGSVENLIAHVDDLKGATQRKVRDNAEQILFSKELATIRTDVPLPEGINPEALVRKPVDVERLRAVYTKLEMRTFLKRLNAMQEEGSQQAAPAATADGEYAGSLFDFDNTAATEPELTTVEIAYTLGDAAAVDALASGSGSIGLALHTCGTQPMTMALMGYALATAKATMYIPLSEDRGARLEALGRLLDKGTITVVGHDVKTAMVVLGREGITFNAPYYDTSVAHYLLEPEMKHYLSSVAAKYLGRSASEALLDAEGRKPDASLAVTATAESAALALLLEPVLTEQLRTQGLLQLLDEIELPLIRVLASMESTGVRIDPVELHKLSIEYTERMNELRHKAFEMAGMEFNVNSPSKVGEVLFEKMKIDPKAKRTKTGAYSTTEEVLEKYSAEHPICRVILDIRGLRKLLTTYIDSLPTLINPATGKIHTTYNQTVTATGRISSTNPNLQNIPIRSDDGREIRRAFIPDPGDLMLSADYSQIELRIIADISGDEAMIEAFNSGHDIHRATAAKIYHRAIEDTPDDLRRNAKTANFGIIYGISAFGLSERLGIPRSEAKELIEGYFRTYPQVREYIDRSIEQAREQGYVTTIMGRKRMLPDINSRSAVVRGYAERNAVNAPIQGSAADIIKRAMIMIFNEMQSLGMASRMIMQVHDELIFNVKPDELPRLQEIVTRCMTHAYSGRVTLEVSSGVGANWLEAH